MKLGMKTDTWIGVSLESPPLWLSVLGLIITASGMFILARMVVTALAA